MSLKKKYTKLEQQTYYNEFDYFNSNDITHVQLYELFYKSLDNKANTNEKLRELLESRHSIKIKGGLSKLNRPILLDLLCKHLTIMHVQGTYNGVSLLEMVCLYQAVHIVPHNHQNRLTTKQTFFYFF
jgi:hypothetical protein